MANEKKMDVVILGFLNHEDLSGYDIKKRMDYSLKYFWSASYGSIYPTLNQLVRQGLAEAVNDQKSERRRVVYHITDQGKKYLTDWLAKPDAGNDLHLETALKVFFGAAGGTEIAAENIEAFADETEKQLEELRRAETILMQSEGEAMDHSYYLQTVRLGIATFEAWLAWCRQAEKALQK